MIRKVKKYFIWMILVFAMTSSYSQKLSFNYIGVNEGLSQNSVTSLVQDTLGRIWIGTRDGLNVYDGSKIKTYRPVRGDSTSLLGYFINDIIADGSTLWVITKSGLSCLNTKTQKFLQFPKKDIISLIKYQGKLFIGTKNGLFTLNVKDKTFRLAKNILPEKLTIKHLYTDRSQTLWIGTKQGLYAYSPKRKFTEKILDTNTEVVFTDSKKQIWIGTKMDGLFLLNNQRREIAHFTHNENKESLVNNIVRDISEDSNGNIWVGTFLGLSIIDGTNHSISNYKHDKSDKKSLSHNSVYSILRDKQGSMWLGTYFGGISYLNNNYGIYVDYSILNTNNKGIGFSVIGEIIEDNDKNLWIATEGGGLDYYNRKTKTFKHYKHEEGKPGLSHNNVKALSFVDNKTLLVGTHLGGLNIINLKSHKVSSYSSEQKDPYHVPYKVVDEIIPYKDYFLLGTKKGVIKFDPKTRTFTQFFSKKEDQEMIGNSVICLLEDSFGTLWIGTEDRGLLSYDSAAGKLRKFESSPCDLKTINGNNISCIFEDHQFRLWIGTHGGGLNQYIRQTDEFVNYNMNSHNLPSDFIQGIMESRFGHLWITSSKGISRLDVENSRIYNHSQKNGLPINEINKGSLYLTSDGEIFIGGINGLISFNEKDILNRSNSFSLNFTSIKVNNLEVTPYDKTNILKQDLPFTQEITLQPEHNVFTINYSTSNYISTDKNTYQYKLENFNEKWIDAGSQTSVTYTNLNPRTYILKVRGLSGVEASIVDQKELIIHIEPPIYRTWYAIIIYIILVLAIILWWNHIYKTRLNLENKIELEQREIEQIKELNQSKLNFFTNISHEFRTPLTLITGTLESVLEDSKTRPENYRKLVKTHNNAVRLNNLITELLDFRKLEHGNIKLKVSEYYLSEFLEEIYQSFVEYSHYHEIEYTYAPLATSQSIWFDKSQMEKVFYNIISNAFKFVQDKTGKIEIKISNHNEYVDVTISDNGVGMHKDKAKQIFDLYYQIDNLEGKTSRHSSGIGLALCKSILKEHDGLIYLESKKGKGTTFTVRLKKGNIHFKESDLQGSQPTTEEAPELIPIAEEYQEDLQQDAPITLSEKTPTILIVEDNPEVQNLLNDLLKPIYKILIASDGNEGIEMAINKQPDLILSDVMMPNLSGTEMCAKLKRNVQTSHIPIILLTARAAVKYKIEGLETGADDYITKPFNTSLLKARVKNVLQNRILMQQKFKQDPKIEVRELTSNSIDEKVLEQAKEIVEKNIDNSEFDVQEFAQAMGIGRTRLYTKIKGVTGQTPNEFILSTRLKKAAELLLNGDEELNVSEIAYSVGFSTPRYFSRCFRQHFGVSPSKYGKVDAGIEKTQVDIDNN